MKFHVKAIFEIFLKNKKAINSKSQFFILRQIPRPIFSVFRIFAFLALRDAARCHNLVYRPQ